MKKLKFISTFALMLVAFVTSAQSIDCKSVLGWRKCTPPYAFSDLSKSIQCQSGKNYEVNLTLLPGKAYRISFYASSIFDNQMQFQIINQATGEKILDVPGETKTLKKGECALREYYDYKLNKKVYPSFDFVPEEIMNLKLVIDIPEYGYKIKTKMADPDLGTEDEFEEYKEIKKGCLTVFVQDMESVSLSCN